MDKYEKRRAMLQALVDGMGRGAIASIAKRIDKEASYVSRMLYPPEKSGAKRIGEDTYEILMAAFPGSFNAESTSSESAAERDVSNRRARLRQWIDEKFNGSQASFVGAHQLNQGEISALLKDKSFGSVKARNLEVQVGMPEQYLEWREGSDHAPSPVAPPAHKSGPDAGYVRLPILAEAAAGHGRMPAQEAVSHIDVLESYVRQKLNANPRNLKVLTARGGSMTGVIEDGDIMFVEPTNEFTDDGIYILTLDDLIRVKRLSVSIASGNVIIESNDGRKPEELPLKEVPHRLHIQGRVLGAWSLKSF